MTFTIYTFVHKSGLSLIRLLCFSHIVLLNLNVAAETEGNTVSSSHISSVPTNVFIIILRFLVFIRLGNTFLCSFAEN